MQKNTSNNRRFALSAKFFFAALCVVFGWFVSSSLSSGSALGETWRFRFDSFDLFSTVARNADETPVCYLDASGRRVGDVVLAASNVDAAPAFFADETELLANDVLVGETEAVGATFDETAPELEPVSFAAAEENAPRFENAGWVVVDADAQDRDKWSLELRFEEFPELTFADSSLPTWRDDVAVEPATLAELRALPFDPNAAASSLVSSSLRRRAAIARLASGDYAFAETANTADANAPQTPNVAPEKPASVPVPTRVGAFTACGAFDAYNGAKVRVQ